MSLIILNDMINDESGDSHDSKRVKITTACDTCRRRKVKCDGESPCSNCLRGSYQCTFTDATSKRPRGPPKGFVALIEDRLHTIESLLVNLSNNKENSSTISALMSDIKDFSDVTNQPGYADEITNEDDEILMNNLIYPNISNTLLSSTLSFLKLVDDQSDSVEPPLPTLPPLIKVDLNPVPDEISNPLFEKYFKYFHPHFPIINRGHFLNNNQPSMLLTEAICAIGAMFPPTGKPNSEYGSQFFYERAKSLLDYFIDVPRLSTIQALLLLYIIDQGKPSSYRSQTYYSNAIKMAQTIGLNRKNGAAYHDSADRQTKKLVWWTCFILDRLNSLNTGDPLTINDKICDIELPSVDEIDQDDMDNDDDDLILTSDPTPKQQINTFISFIRIAKITGQILEHLQAASCEGLQASRNHHSTTDIFESLLSDWSRELPSYLNYVPSSSLPGQIANLHMQHQTLYLLLHYPYIAEHSRLRRDDRIIRTSRTFLKKMNACSTAANTITNIGVDALNDVQTCSTFPTMFYCLGKAAKVHSLNITSPQRGLAITSYKNIIKTIKVCRFYKQNNIMKELVQKTTALLENILIKHQDKFSHEEIFGVTPTGEIVNPDGLDLTLSCLGNSLSDPSIGTPIGNPTIKISPPSRGYSIDSATSNNSARRSQKRKSFTQDDQLVPNIVTTAAAVEFADSLAAQMQISSWMDGFDDNSYDQVTSTGNQSPIPQMLQADYFSQPQQRTQSLPNVNSQINDYNPNIVNKSHSLSSYTHAHRQNRYGTFLGVEPIYSSPSSSPLSPLSPSPLSPLSPTLQQQSPRYVFTDINDNEIDSFTSENNNNFVISQGNESSLMYGFHKSNSTTTNETTIFNRLFGTTTPSSSRSRMTSPSPTLPSTSKIKENDLLQFTSGGSKSESSINNLGVSGVTTPPDTDTSIDIGIDEFDQFEPNGFKFTTGLYE